MYYQNSQIEIYGTPPNEAGFYLRPSSMYVYKGRRALFFKGGKYNRNPTWDAAEIVCLKIILDC